MKKVTAIFGTRPEAIKMAPVIEALAKSASIQTSVVVTAQHRNMLDQVLDLFGIVPDVDLDLMRPDQDLDALFSSVLTGVSRVLQQQQPDLVLVHGDTTTALAAALAAYHARVPVAHVEAGLRTGNLQAPWPEEANRRLVAPLAALHFAPTEQAKANLLREGIDPDSIIVTGNTVIDALLLMQQRIEDDASLLRTLESQFHFIAPKRRLILVTGHRRENFGPNLDAICEALARLAQRDDVQIVYPVHLNPQVSGPVGARLSGLNNVFVIEPQEYLAFAYLMSRAHLIITDSGGIQEEAPSLGKPVLVTREVTERPEAVDAGTVRLVGADTDQIIKAATELLEDAAAYRCMTEIHNPYGDGNAAQRICEHLRLTLLGLTPTDSLATSRTL